MSDVEITKDQVKDYLEKGSSFVELIEPLRPELYRYCRGLTGNPWDADDLAQETIVKAYGKLASVHMRAFERPKHYLFRMATNTWIDQKRRESRMHLQPEPEEKGYESEKPAEVSEALMTLAQHLPEQERAALLMKDVFSFSLKDIASYLTTSVGAIKAALHRARAKIAELNDQPVVHFKRNAAGSELQRAFVEAFNARELDQLMALFSEYATAEIPGVLDEEGREVIRDGSMLHTLFMIREGERIPLPDDAPRAELVELGDETVIVLWYPIESDGEARTPGVGDVLRLEEVEGQVQHLQWYYFSPDVLEEVADVLGAPANPHGYRFTGHH